MAGFRQRILGFLDRSAESLHCLVFRGGLLHLILLFCLAGFVWPITHLDEFTRFAKNRLQWDMRIDIAMTTGIVFAILCVLSAITVFVRRKMAGHSVLQTIRLMNDWFLWSLALPFILVAGIPTLERKHTTMSLCVIVAATVIFGIWMYRLLGRYHTSRQADVAATEPAELEHSLSERGNGTSSKASAPVETTPAVLSDTLVQPEFASSPLISPSENDQGVTDASLSTESSSDDGETDDASAEAFTDVSSTDDGDVWDESVQSVSLNAAPSSVDAMVPLAQPAVETASRWPGILAWTGLLAMAGAFAHHFSRLAINNHHSFRSQMADLGYYDNIFYQSIHGNPLGCTFLLGEVHYSSHFDPLLVLMSPLYLLYPQAEGILVIQSVWLALGIIPMYLITQNALGKRWLSVLMGGLLLAYAPLHGPALYDFHSLTLLGPLALWLMYAIQRRSWRWFYVFLVLCLLTREDISFVMFLVGVSILLSLKGTDRKHGWFTIAAAISYFVFVKTSVMISSDLLNCSEGGTCFGSMFKDLAPAKKGSGEILLSLWTTPSHALAHFFNEKKVLYFCQLFIPLCFIPLLAPRGRIIMLFGIAVIGLGTKFALFSIGFQYSTWIYPFAFAITPLALKHLSSGGHPWIVLDRRRLIPTLVTGMVVASVLLTWRYGAFVKNDAFRGGFGRVTYEIKDGHVKRLEWLREAVKKIPVQARLGASRHMAPHVSNRPFVYPFPTWGRKGKPGPEYLLVRLRDLRKKARALQADIRDGYYKVLAKSSDIYVLKVTDWSKVKPKKRKPKRTKKRKRAKKKKTQLRKKPAVLGAKASLGASLKKAKALAKRKAAQKRKTKLKLKKGKKTKSHRKKQKRRRSGPRVR